MSCAGERRRRRDDPRPPGARLLPLVPGGLAGPVRRGVRRAAGRRHRGTTALAARTRTSRAAASSPGSPTSAWRLPAPRGDRGAGGTAADPQRQVRASLGTLGAALAVCLAFGAAMRSQLTIGWERQPRALPSAADPDPPSSVWAREMPPSSRQPRCWSCCAGDRAAIPVLATVAVRLRPAARRRPGVCPPAVCVAAAAVLFAGGRHFENGWVGTGGHGGLIPGGVAAFEWATSLGSPPTGRTRGRSPPSRWPSEPGWRSARSRRRRRPAAATVVRRAGLSLPRPGVRGPPRHRSPAP